MQHCTGAKVTVQQQIPSEHSLHNAHRSLHWIRMNFKLLCSAHLYPSSLSHLLQGLPLTCMRIGPWPMRWHSRRGHCNPPACKLTDSEAVVELEAAEYLVDISCMIKAVASYHNLKGFCKQKHSRFMIYLWEKNSNTALLFRMIWIKTWQLLFSAWYKTSTQTLPLFSSNVQECYSGISASDLLFVSSQLPQV